jgi:hypothetical protein
MIQKNTSMAEIINYEDRTMPLMVGRILIIALGIFLQQ